MGADAAPAPLRRSCLCRGCVLSELQRALDALGVALAAGDRDAAAYWRQQIAELGQAPARPKGSERS
jgi:hypothetical protein